jgi:excisionase family DNA binding protein
MSRVPVPHEGHSDVLSSSGGRPVGSRDAMTTIENDRRAPLVVPPRQACQMLSVGLTRLYELLHEGALESYRHGRSRRITTKSIRAYIERQIAASPSTWGPPP